MAHQLPVDQVVGADGHARWRRSPSGLVSALHPVVAGHEGAWIGAVCVPTEAPVPFHHDGIEVHPVGLSPQDVAEYLDGQSHATIRPLYHDAVDHPVFHRRWRDAYARVNQRFAVAAAEIAAPGATVWVHDYQLQLVPAMLREHRPDLRIGFFLHAPFPPVELFMQLPLRTRIMRGLLGADVIGFQRPRGTQNFLELAQHLLGLTPQGNRLSVGGRDVLVDAFPISIDVGEIERLAADPDVRARAAEIRAELGDPRTVMLGVDRFDSAKGIEQRLKAYGELLEEGRLSAADTVLVQVAAPAASLVRAAGGRYPKLRQRVDREIARINGAHGRVGHPAVHYLHRHHDRAELVALYLAADVMLVTPLRSGMNLVAKEYVAARTDDTGVLVLSEFTGAAADLPQALLVNPHDVDAVKETVLRALGVAGADAAERMAAMRAHLRGHDVRRWADGFLSALGAPQPGTGPGGHGPA